MVTTDVLVVGSGIAGLLTAIKVAERFPDRNVTLLTKGLLEDSNTRYAQGGISVVTDYFNDSKESHIQDTLNAGDGLCDPNVVAMVVNQASERLLDLLGYGVRFDTDQNGQFLLGKEGGHQHNRIIHCKDTTGASVSSALISFVSKLPNVAIFNHHAVIDLIVEEPPTTQRATRTCVGAFAFNKSSGKIEVFSSRTTVLATGGVGQVYSVTTNPTIATGDGIAIAKRAGANVSNMEFIQFHPTALNVGDSNPCFLISEAVRGHGAHLINGDGEQFMWRYHRDGELACRDVVARAIAMEIAHGHEVYLDCTHIADEFENAFPSIHSKCSQFGLDLYYNPIPVTPAAHYLCGGIDVDLYSRTSIKNLYACGECANTGLHGANRLASNSLLEAAVFAHNCYDQIASVLDNISCSGVIPDLKLPDIKTASECLECLALRERLQAVMSKHVGIVRSHFGLTQAFNELTEIKIALEAIPNSLRSIGWYELRNMIAVSILIVDHSLQRNENRGGYYNCDLDVSQVLTPHDSFPV